MDSYLAAGKLIQARLADKLTSVPPLNIRQSISLEWVVANALDPSVNIIYHDDKVDMGESGNSQKGKSQLVHQIWLILVTVKNSSDAGVAAEADAGVILSEVIAALQGYEIRKELNPLHRIPCVYRKTEKDGYVHLPLMYATKVITTGVS